MDALRGLGALAEVYAQYGNKGSRIYVDGRLRTQRWEDDSGQLRTMVEIVILDLILLDRCSAPSMPDDADELPC